ncbi:SCO family protein [Geobacter sulfurreducens]|uniref:SCO family protein n=1 Tax=Geobacter sulfurreducens (strain ATCC 51573 / DSM 12127 / PCA) TaxID=243231 RepID=Q74DQ9_GEOSL|nr:SCO family protein [Geobacter sulfurreducens PCA]AJY70966.1 SCO family protein [Geobacter sulfurreducens]QVW36471.1 SCO family protein [Geobacter sulfurreducens]UAC05285.1 SCO family protein [Geobacter sulfurreducens]UTG93922.1 SCO family protein [Geobacter sulfurreducens]
MNRRENHVRITLSAPVIALCLLLAATLLPCTAAAAPQSPQGTALDRRTDEAARAYFTDLKLTTHEGKVVRFYTDILKDRVVLIHFFYTNCKTVATLQTKVLSDLQPLLGDRLGKDIFLVSISVDPARDTLEHTRAYARAFAPRPGWTFLTGSKVNLDWVNYKLGNYKENPEEHETFFLLGNLRTGHWIKNKPETSARTLAEHLIQLADEKQVKR